MRGEMRMAAPGGYWVYGRGCTEPGGGIAPAWGFVPHPRGGRPAFAGEPAVGDAGPMVPSVWALTASTAGFTAAALAWAAKTTLLTSVATGCGLVIGVTGALAYAGSLRKD